MNPSNQKKGARSLATVALLSSATGAFAQTEGQESDFRTATTIPSSGVITEQIYPVRDIDTYRFTLTEPKILTASTTGPVDTFGCLFTERRSLVTMASGGGPNGNFHLAEVLEPGSYFLQVSSFSASDTGEYDLTLALADVPSNNSDLDGDSVKELSPRVDINSSVAASLIPNDVDFFRVTIYERQTLTLFSSGRTDTYGYLVDAAGNEIASNDDGGSGMNFQIQRTLDPGTYYARVRGFSAHTSGLYNLHVTSSEESSRTIDFVGERDFGNVPVGSESVSQIWIANTGNVGIDVAAIELPEGYTGVWPRRVLEARTRMPIEVTFNPTATGEYSGMLDVTVMVTEGPTQTMLSGTAVAATDPNLGEEYQEATYVYEDGAVSAEISNDGQMIRYDASEDMILNLGGLPAGAISLQSANGVELSTTGADASFALSQGTYFLQVVPELSGTYDLTFASEAASNLKTNLEIEGDSAKVSFLSEAGKTYQFEYSEDLTNWEVLDTMSGTGATLECVGEATSTRKNGFYRISEASGE
jgi:hypothetical protein